MREDKIKLENVGYMIHDDVLAKYPDFKLIILFDTAGVVIAAEPAFQLHDPVEIIERMLLEVETTDEAHSMMRRLRVIDFNEAMEKVGFGLPFKNYPILHALLELGFITKDEVQYVE